MIRCEEAQELITALVDNELRGAERESIEGHLGVCSACKTVYEQQKMLKKAIGWTSRHMHAPAGLRERILADRRIFPETSDRNKSWKEYIWLSPIILRPALIVALLLVLALPAFYILNQRSQSVSLAAFETYNMALRGNLPTIQAASAEEMKEQLSRATEGRFEPPGYDLSTVGLYPVAGAIRDVGERRVLVVVYRSPESSLLCYSFLGTESDVPPNAALFFDPEGRMNFYGFSHAGVNAILHREGKTICILVSPMPMQDLLALAKSKAVVS